MVVGAADVGGTLEGVVLRGDVVAAPHRVAEEERGRAAQVLDDGQVADPADDGAERQPGSGDVEQGKDREPAASASGRRRR